MNKSKTPVSKATNKVQRRATPFLGEQDTAKLVWSSRTHRSVSEAFKDADYATPIWRCETEWDRFKEYMKWGTVWALTMFSLYSVAMWFEGVVR